MPSKPRRTNDPDNPVHIHKPGTFPATGRNVGFTLNEGTYISGRFEARLSWDVTASPRDIVIHLSAFLVDEDSKVLGGNPFYCVNHDNDRSKDGSTLRRGRRKHGHVVSDETITVELDEVDPDIRKIVFVTYIQDAILLKHSFGSIKGGAVTLRQLGEDGSDENAVILPEQLLNGDYYESETAVIIGELFRRSSGNWAYRDISEGYSDMVEVGNEYGVIFVPND